MSASLAVRLCMICALPVLLAACAVPHRQEAQRPHTKDSFMDAWHSYSHCLSSKDPEAIVSDLRALTQFSDSVSTISTPRIFRVLPYSLAPLPSRLAVDPIAMVSACADHGAQVARSLEQPRGSAELLITAVEAQHRLRKTAD
jgi:hypothetical protein